MFFQGIYVHTGALAKIKLKVPEKWQQFTFFGKSLDIVLNFSSSKHQVIEMNRKFALFSLIFARMFQIKFLVSIIRQDSKKYMLKGKKNQVVPVLN
jgi:hypothetical protein